MPLPIVHALARIKGAAARVNRNHGLDAGLAEAIVAAADAVVAGDYDDQFPLAIWQTGSGTQSNMNANERSEEHTSELQSLMRISYAVFCLKKKKTHNSKEANNR